MESPTSHYYLDAQANLEQHWDTWITTSDWQFIVNQGLNTIRLPIGYVRLILRLHMPSLFSFQYHLSQASIIANTDFAAYGTVFR
jgi:aryl-phospho-beta-D-glucosidase BglC (GH1 family)